MVDASNISLGRLATHVASLIRGKNKPYFTPHVDCGDNVIVKNADKIKLTGNKWKEKIYIRHTGYPGGQKKKTPTEMLEKDGTSVVRHAIKGMLPKNKLGRAILKNCYIYSTEEHNQNAQKPELLNLKNLK